MSSMRNAVSRRPHKERAQPKSREKWGLLEKHKDYSLRARDYNIKKAKLAALAQKARDKNQDEFAFGMLSANKRQAGRHGRGNDEVNRLSHDAVKLLKTQDAGYLRVVAGRARKELKRLQESVVQVENVAGKGKKVVFLDEEGEEGTDSGLVDTGLGPSARGVDEEGSFKSQSGTGEPAPPRNDQPDPKTSSTPKSKKALAAERDSLRAIRIARKRRKRLQASRATKLEALRKQQREVLAVADELEAQRARMANTVGGVNKDGVRWKIRERKR